MKSQGTNPIAELNRLTVSLRGGYNQQNGCLVLNFTGQLDAYSEKQFTSYINEVLDSNQLSVVIDLTNIDFIDSCGLGAMVQTAKKCSKSKRAFNVVGNPRVVQTIKLVRLEEFLHLAPDLNTAINRLSA